MSNPRGKTPMSGKKKAGIAAGIVLGIVIILFICAYLLFRHYYGLMNHEPLSETPSLNTEEFEEETLPPEETDSPEDEIQALEDELNANKTDLVYSDHVLNILLIGTDGRRASERGRSDSMILVSINEETHQVIMTSIMRDIYVQIEGHGSNRINAAYAYGGAELLIPTIQNYFGVRIDKYVRVNFGAFESIIDQIGGVTLTISADEAKWINHYTDDEVEVKDQTIRLNGKQALAYSRIRYLAGSDFGRTERQRKVLTAIFNEAKSLNLLQLNDLLNALLPQLTTDFTEGETFSLLLNAPSYLGYELVSFRVPIDGSYRNMNINRRSVLGIDFAANREALITTIYGQ